MGALLIELALLMALQKSGITRFTGRGLPFRNVSLPALHCPFLALSWTQILDFCPAELRVELKKGSVPAKF